MTDYRFVVRITLRGPVISRGVATGRVGIDALTLRDPNGQPALPGSLIRGTLRESWQHFGWGDQIDLWLGTNPRAARDPNKQQSDYRRPRSPLRFDTHWRAERRGNDQGFRHRIRVEPDTGAVSGGGLMLIESPFGPGEELTFSGGIELRWPRSGPVAERLDALAGSMDDKLAELRRQLHKGLTWPAALGGLKGVGFGRLLRVEVGEASPLRTGQATLPDAVRAAGNSPRDLAIGLRIRPQGAFCFPEPGAKGTLGNRYRSGEIIPGAALKAALAGSWPKSGAWGKLRDTYLDPLRISPAVPVGRGGDLRPLAIPFSLAFVERAADACDPLDLARDPDAIFRYPRVPRLQPDWKTRHHQAARRLCGWDAAPRRGLEIHNAIDPDTGTVDFDTEREAGLLFSLETVAPDAHWWLANLKLPAVAPADRPALIDCLQDLLAQGLAPLGKTDMAAVVDAIEAPWALRGTGTSVLRDGLAIVTLQSTALLLPPGIELPNANGDAALAAAYADSFSQLSGGSPRRPKDGALELVRCFARQQLGGGRYWWNAFRDRERPYRPVLLTQPGSVFVLRPRPGRERQAEAILIRWRDHGLPPHPQAPGGIAPGDWRTNLWLTENGYGEVAINAELHWRAPPTPEQSAAAAEPTR